MNTPTDFEQEMLELLNRARLDPQGEFDALIGTASNATGVTAGIRNAVNFFNVDLDVFRAQIAVFDPVAPVAWSSSLNVAATGHSEKMIEVSAQGHLFEGELGLGDRITAAGYDNWRTVSENVFAYTDNPVQGHAGFFIDWGFTSTGIQDPAGHRLTILNEDFTDVGIAALAETDSSTALGPWVVTQNFGARFTNVPQLVGVVLKDADGDRFYDAGEGLEGVTITATNASGDQFVTTSWGSGGYQMELASGTYDVTFSGGNLSGTLTDEVTITDANVKLDGFAGDATQSEIVQGTPGNDWLTPGSGNDTVVGGAGSDMISFVDLEQAVNVNLETQVALSGNDTNTLEGIENVTGTIYGDYIQGDAGDNLLRGLGNYDWFIGSEGRDSYEGGSGRDMVSYVFSQEGVTVNLSTGVGEAGLAMQDSYTSIERVTGSVHSDLMFGSDKADDFRGLGGYDWFVGSGGGKDRYDGGSGLDTVSYALSTEGVTASLLAGRGSSGDAARDLYTSIERLTGSSFDDLLIGDHGRNELRGLFGEDSLYGNGGVDRLTGGGADDYLDGGDGFDYAIYENARDDYTVTQHSTHVTVQYNGGGGDGTDTLLNIEALIFSDDLVFL
ncbi:CAP domain-containing protein (plasmid) [Sulfitobacter sp. S223]|uniref:CAP domain-containing protein n=1 Tax=Sulfitobacter sp. S223 TaxID=2867023 RepID=UPI0021A88862|nr:CAP domain-containing protein [Sulfitobacter sp. S223]UWR28346.1 CAP domain-containing protein [Sulfitobacter sp. S223]